MVKWAIFAVIVLAVILFVYKSSRNNNQPLPTINPASTLPTFIEKQATFKIVTNGTVRIFTDKKYHNLSPEVYITSKDPEVIYIKKQNIKWSDFFATLPMKLTKDCLTTGTGQIFCTNSEKSLKFYINGIENKNALDEVINTNDYLLVEYK